MEDRTKTTSATDAEKTFLRKAWWVFPMGGWMLSLAWGGPFWRWVTTESIWPPAISSLFGPRAWILAGIGLVLPGIWAMGQRLKMPRGAAVLAALLAVAGADAGLGSRRAQIPFWLAARARLAPGQHFMRETCYVRIEEAAGRGDGRPGIVLVGSSQVLHGIDEQMLRELVWPIPVIRRAVFGTSPLKALAMMTCVPYRRGDVCVQYLSEFDFSGQDPFPYSWFRPFASWKTLPGVMASAGATASLREWRGAADYAMAASFETWSSRDFLRQMLFHFWSPEPEPKGGKEKAKAKGKAWEESAPRYMPGEERAFEEYIARLKKMGVGLVVFEGDVHPSMHSAARIEARERVRGEMEERERQGVMRHVSIEEQGLGLGTDDWLDKTHLNAAGREKLTRRIAGELAKP